MNGNDRDESEVASAAGAVRNRNRLRKVDDATRCNGVLLQPDHLYA